MELGQLSRWEESALKVAFKERKNVTKLCNWNIDGDSAFHNFRAHFNMSFKNERGEVLIEFGRAQIVVLVEWNTFSQCCWNLRPMLHSKGYLNSRRSQFFFNYGQSKPSKIMSILNLRECFKPIRCTQI